MKKTFVLPLAAVIAATSFYSVANDKIERSKSGSLHIMNRLEGECSLMLDSTSQDALIMYGKKTVGEAMNEDLSLRHGDMVSFRFTDNQKAEAGKDNASVLTFKIDELTAGKDDTTNMYGTSGMVLHGTAWLTQGQDSGIHVNATGDKLGFTNTEANEADGAKILLQDVQMGTSILATPYLGKQAGEIEIDADKNTVSFVYDVTLTCSEEPTKP